MYNSNGLKLIDKWFYRYMDITPHSRYLTCKKLLEMSTPSNTSILRYNEKYNDCVVSIDIEKDIITAGTVIIDFYLYKDKKHFDTTIRCLPPINDGAIPNIATSKKQKFFTLGSNAPDFNMFALFYNFVKFRDISKFPVATISEAHSRIKDIDPDTYIRNFVLALTKEVS